MTKILALLMFVATVASAQSIDLPAPSIDQSFSQLLANKAKEMRPAVLIGPYTAPAYSAFLPVWTFHAAYDKDAAGKEIIDHYRDTVELGAGGKYEAGSKDYSAFLAGDLNFVALSARLWDFAWARTHVRRSQFPNIFIGPALTLPVEWKEYKDAKVGDFLKQNSRIMLSVAVTLGK